MKSTKKGVKIITKSANKCAPRDDRREKIIARDERRAKKI